MNELDVIVIGGGPAGSTAAHLLAQAGVKVLVIEREVFPRFHIGESLLPRDLEIFQRLGLDLEGVAAHVHKRGAEMYEEASHRHAVYLFADSLAGTATHAFQVDRARFDLALLEGAERAGARVQQGERVKDVALEGPDDVEVVTDKGRYRGRYVLDATGQDSLFAHRHKSRERIEEFGQAVVFRHFDELAPAIAEELAATGNIKILFVEDGWLWAIPLAGGQRLSVGLVSRKKGIEKGWLDAAIEESPELRRLLRGARPEGPHTRLGSFSFFNRRPHGARWACVGDAACFLDPVFSSGVTFAMLGASHAADALVPALAEGREGEPGLMDAHAAYMTHGYSVFATLILSLYQRRLLPGLFFTAEQDPELRRGLTTVLAGDVWRDDNPFQNQLWSSVRRRFEIPTHVAG